MSNFYHNVKLIISHVVDQDFGSMDGIINPEYRNNGKKRVSISQVSVRILYFILSKIY